MTFSRELEFRLVIIAVVLLLCFIFAVFYSIYYYREKKIFRLEKCIYNNILFKVTEEQKSDKKLVLVGDSRIVGWGKNDFGNKTIDIYRVGILGGTSNEILCAVQKSLCKQKSLFKNVDLYVIQIGINDLVAASLMEDKEREKIKQRLLNNIRTLIGYLSMSDSHILILSIVPPIKVGVFRKLVWGKTIAKDAEEISQILQNEFIGKISFYDMKNIMYDFEKKIWKESLAFDALHWKKEVYESLNLVINDMIYAH